jgi:ABC-type Mn2+/Zn2+ transport system ATPase subunit
MIIIEIIGKTAVNNSIRKASNQMLNAKLNSITNIEYEHKINSIIHHGKNLIGCVRNLFIEFPRKAVACYHYIIALNELSFEIMIYCTVVSIIFTIVSLIISYYRERLISEITDYNTRFSLIASDVSNSIQSYKVDKRLVEYKKKFDNVIDNTQLYYSCDSFMIGCGDMSSGISSQFMIGLISYMCRPHFIEGSLSLYDLLYGINSSYKFVEKLVGVIDYFGDVIRQYKSFEFFLSINIIELEPNITQDSIKTLSILTHAPDFYRRDNIDITQQGNIIRICGGNGVGKTTILLNLLGVAYKGATSTGKIVPLNNKLDEISYESYRNGIAFVQQAVPITYDTIKNYIAAVTGIQSCAYNYRDVTTEPRVYNYRDSIKQALINYGMDTILMNKIMIFLTTIKSNKEIRSLSGGQAKMIQILAAISKCYYNSIKIIVMDEPSNNLDTEKVEYLIEIIKCLKSKGITILLVTHDKRLLFDNTLRNINLS